MKRMRRIRQLVFVLAITLLGSFSMGTVKAADAGNDQAVLRNAAEAYFARMPANMYKIPEKGLKEWLDSAKPGLFLLDIRDEKDYAAGHIATAINIPFREVGRNLDKLPQDKTIVVYCYTGQTAGQTAAVLNMAGFTALSLNGGMNNGWLKQKFPVVADSI